MANTIVHLTLAGAATVAALAVFGGAQPGEHAAVADGARIVNVDNGDENFVNDNGQTSGDIFPAERPGPKHRERHGNVARRHTPSTASAASMTTANPGAHG